MNEPAFEFEASPAEVALVAMSLHRPGGWTRPVRLTCAGHDSGSALQLRVDGAVVAVRGCPRSALTMQEPEEDPASFGWLLDCGVCGREHVRSGHSVRALSLEALADWQRAGGVGRLRLRWT